jgi:hypothetical protein
MTINLMLSDLSFKTKPTSTDCGIIKFCAKQCEVTPQELIDAIERGQTVIPAVMSGTKAADWQEQQLFMVDVDNAVATTEILTPDDAIINCRDNGITPVFYYHTFSSTESHPKYRLCFLFNEVVRDKALRDTLAEYLVNLFDQADKSCKNADRLFFGTDKKVMVVEGGGLINVDDLQFSTSSQSTARATKTQYGELAEMKRSFDLLGYMIERNGECTPIRGGYKFKNCELCGHRDDLVYYADNNSFRCFGANCNESGSIIDYIMLSEKVDVKTAIDKLYQMSGRPRSQSVVLSDSWQQPVTFHDSNLPHFPIETIPSPFRAYIEAVAEHTQTAIDMPAMNVMGVVATAIQGKTQVMGKDGYVEPLNIYVLIIAKPAERKSSVSKEAANILYRYEEEMNMELQPIIDEQRLQRDILTTALNKAVQKGKEEDAVSYQTQIRELDKDSKCRFRLFTSDTTPEALTSLLYENNGRFAVISAEGGIFNILAGQYNKGGANIETVLKAHNGDSIRVDRKGRDSESINNPCLTMIISLQERVVNELFANSQFTGRGLVSRMLYCKPASLVSKRKYDTQPIEAVIRQAYENAVRQLLGCSDTTSMLRLSEEAQDISRSWFDYLEPLHAEELSNMGDWSGKLHGATLRIAGLLHCMEHWSDMGSQSIISGETMRNAVKIGKYLLEHAKWAYSIICDERLVKARYVLGKIVEDGGQTLSRRDILRLCRKFDKVEELTPALNVLEEYGYIRRYIQEPTHPGCKPNVLYEINPNVTNVTDVTEE